MIGLYINPETNDLEFDMRKSFRVVSGVDEVSQHIRHRLLTNRGEWFLDTTYGLDYSEIVGRKIVENDPRIEAAIDDCISRDPRGFSIQSFSLEGDHHGRNVSIVVDVTVDGYHSRSEVRL